MNNDHGNLSDRVVARKACQSYGRDFRDTAWQFYHVISAAHFQPLVK
jgi:hypothetical protein